jgi:thiamine-phosphate pyrophosphorylase
MSLDIRLIAILDPAARGATALDAARAAEGGGATMLQVRMKHSAAADFLAWTERLVAALRIPVWVNDRADVAWLAGAAGVHLGADDLPATRVRAHAPHPMSVGVSVGSSVEADRAVRMTADYWSLGSVFATGSKADAGDPIGVAGVARLARRAPAGVPCVAIGGMTAERVTDVCAAGAKGIAAISAVFDGPDVEQRTRLLRDAVDAALAR